MTLPWNKHTYVCTIVICLALVSVFSLAADTITLPNGAKLDLSVKCPVCKMEVGSTKLGPAAVVFKGGKVTGFDSTGDLFRYLLEPKKYGFDPGAIEHVYVTQYGTKNVIDAKQAAYVVGSDVKGSMGREVVAFAGKAAAQKFMSAHHGKNVVSYGEVGLSDLRPKKGLLRMQHGH